MVKTYKVYICQELRKQCELQVSQKAIKEYMDRVLLGLEINAQRLDEIARSNNRRTIFEEDVIELFGFKSSSTIKHPEEPDE